MTENPENHEEAARRFVKWTEDFFDWVLGEGRIRQSCLASLVSHDSRAPNFQRG